MKHQQVTVDYWTMFKTSGMCLLLAVCGFVLLKMVQTIFWLPGHLKKNQQRLEELAKIYAKDISEEERAEIEKLFNSKEPVSEERINQLLDKSETSEPKKEQ
ncbi:uncharacterized protein LOC6536950 [Drosophila yakuba]|uniref:Uncharacterized protein n=1 Tax=Drosophila yakuba TaxID=7245 RepID=B4PQ04_DROYA|nr:uncharacterized protein LOC6536950 [Drosophila yakuba]XP_039495681.1 uncharacterized protein LOC120454445 [Drosophila santomea]EDW97231.1 uncharacterized protein Dyak_GE26268 [Drosophila yakuba]